MDNYDPYSANPRAVAGNNQSPYERIKTEIEDLYAEAKNFADGEPIANQEQADAVTELHDSLHAKGKEADDLRAKEKEPHDKAAAEVQARFNLLIGNTKTTGKGKVVLGKEVLAGLLTPWRNAEAAKKEAIARAAREEADRIAAQAQAAIRASAGNLEAREDAEQLLRDAKATDRDAKRADKAATTGTGLRTIWHCKLEDEVSALEWAYSRAPEQFIALVQSMAEGVVRSGVRAVPGFAVTSERIA